jgi:hypothetical protein
MALIELNGCFFDKGLLEKSHGFESLDPVGREAFVNHLHLTGDNRVAAAAKIIESWKTEMCSRWPARQFRIYSWDDSREIVVRFHALRPHTPNWCEGGLVGLEIITVGGT